MILPELLRQIKDALKDYAHEIILVNDGSSDKSWETICENIVTYPRVVGINLRKNSGQDNAIMAGLSISQGAHVVIMDDDLQHSPYDIPVLRKQCEDAHSDVCFAHFPQKKQAPWKNLGSWANGKIANKIIGKPDNVYLSPFKILKSEVVREITKYNGPYPYIDGLLFTITRNVTQVDTENHERLAGKSNYTFIKSFNVFMKLATNFSIFPLRIVSVLGSLIAVIAFLLTIRYCVEYFVLHNSPEGWTTLVILVLFLSGSNFIFLGLIGEYIGRTYLSINKRPQYVIKDIIIGESVKHDSI
ncbi:glycosyl transferase [Spirochaetia bacterium]|nr:glycosyl transferase [Spirochaetia bacterium]